MTLWRPRWKGEGWKTAAVLVAWLVLVAYYLPILVQHVVRSTDHFTFGDDVRILVWPYLSPGDTALFKGDFFARYYQAGLPELYRIMMQVAARLNAVEFITKTIPYLSLLGVVWLIADMARRAAGHAAAWLAAALVLGSAVFLDRAGGGLPRAFAFPLTAAGLHALLRGRARLLAWLTVAAMGFYPVVAAILGLSLFGLLLLPARARGDTANSSLKKRATLLVVAAAASTLMALPVQLRLRPYGDPITPARIAAYPEAGPGGRLDPTSRPPFDWFPVGALKMADETLVGVGDPVLGSWGEWLRSEPARRSWFTGLLFAAALCWWMNLARRRADHLRLLVFLVAVGIGNTLARTISPYLFLPERYLRYGMPPLVIVIVAAAAVGWISPIYRKFSRIERYGALGWVGPFSLVLLLGARGTCYTGMDVAVPPEEQPMYRYLGSLPRAAVIAGWPIGPLENVPYLSHRRVLTNFQLEIPFHVRFTNEIRRRLAALWKAYFAVDPGPIEHLRRDFGVTHLVMSPPGESLTYYLPHVANIWSARARLAGKVSLLSLLARDPERCRVFGAYRVVDIRGPLRARSLSQGRPVP